MISIQIICVGKIKENSIECLCSEYLKRLSKYAKVTVIEIADEKADLVRTQTEIEKIKKIECDKIMSKIPDKSYTIALDLNGKMYTSEQLSAKLSTIATYHSSSITFIIGGSLGLTKQVTQRADEVVSFSTLTFPHQLFRIFLLEQLFRSFKIQHNEHYHK